MKPLLLSAIWMGFAAAASAETTAFPPDAASEVRTNIEDGRYGTVTSLIVMQHGEIVLEEYFEGTDAETPRDTRSSTKTITGMAMGLAVADGAITLDTLVLEFFPEVQPVAEPDPRKAAITPYDLITMSGPLECNDWEPISRGNEERMYLVEDWAGFYWDLPIAAVRPWETPASERPHGRVFSYCTTGVQILGAAIARAVGQPIDDYLQARLFDPLGIPRPEWQRLAGRDAFAGGGIRFRSRDLVALAELYRNGGLHDGERLIPGDWVARSLQEHAVITDIPGRGYGFLWWRRDYEDGGATRVALEMAGNGGNRVTILPEHGLVIVVTKTDFNTRGMHDQTDRLIAEEIVARLTQGG